MGYPFPPMVKPSSTSRVLRPVVVLGAVGADDQQIFQHGATDVLRTILQGPNEGGDELITFLHSQDLSGSLGGFFLKKAWDFGST